MEFFFNHTCLFTPLFQLKLETDNETEQEWTSPRIPVERSPHSQTEGTSVCHDKFRFIYIKGFRYLVHNIPPCASSLQVLRIFPDCSRPALISWPIYMPWPLLIFRVKFLFWISILVLLHICIHPASCPIGTLDSSSGTEQPEFPHEPCSVGMFLTLDFLTLTSLYSYKKGS
jgi:hypothetical protein